MVQVERVYIWSINILLFYILGTYKNIPEQNYFNFNNDDILISLPIYLVHNEMLLLNPETIHFITF